MKLIVIFCLLFSSFSYAKNTSNNQKVTEMTVTGKLTYGTLDSVIDDGNGNSIGFLSDDKMAAKIFEKCHEGDLCKISALVENGEYGASLKKLISIERINEQISATNSNTTSGNLTSFDNLNKFGGGSPEDIFKDKKIDSALKKLLGKNLNLLKQNIAVSEGITINNAGALESSGCAPHVCTIEDAKIYIERSGGIYVAIHTDSKILYFTTEETSKTKPIDPINEFIKSYPDAKLIFMSK
ncbi:MAG: hypothetical protein NTW85_11635 [Methylococcales bacterium]|nr:hypothetical protein [Methylococcales bacterium]